MLLLLLLVEEVEGGGENEVQQVRGGWARRKGGRGHPKGSGRGGGGQGVWEFVLHFLAGGWSKPRRSG